MSVIGNFLHLLLNGNRLSAAPGTRVLTLPDVTDTLVAVTTNVIQKTEVTLTNAQIKALPSTPITIVPAQGAGYVINVLACTYISTFNFGAYTNINGSYADIGLHQGAGGRSVAGYIANDQSVGSPGLEDLSFIFGNNFDIVYPGLRSVSEHLGYITAGNPAGMASASAQNAPIVVQIENNGSGNFTGGHASNTLKVIVYWTKEAL